MGSTHEQMMTQRRKKAKERRDRLRDEGRCIGDRNDKSHGPPVSGGRCIACNQRDK